jgi:hypothetical protein
MKSGKEYREVKQQLEKLEKYARHQIAVGADALAILRKNGVVGCLHDDSDLSEKYKEKLIL